MPRSRIIISWAFFVLGIAAILFGGYGLVTHSPWSDSVNSLCTIFGTMMSFSQLFVGFPSPMRLTRDKADATLSPAYPPQQSSFYAQQYQPYSFQNQSIAQTSRGFSPVLSMDVRKLYKRSGIFLLLAAVCAFIEGLIFFSGGASLPLTSFVILQISIICENTLFVFALRGFYMKQAQQAGWLGVLSAIVVGTGYIFYALTYSFTLFLTLNLAYAAKYLNTVGTLSYIDGFFYTLGLILFGLAIIRAGVYPRWTGTIIIVLGVYSGIDTLLGVSTTADEHLIRTFVYGIAAFLYSVLYVRWSFTLFKK